MAQLLEEEKMRILLREKYHFSVKDLYSLTEKHLFADSILERRYEEIEYCNHQLELEKHQLQQEVVNCQNLISEYANSTSWKITEPLRKMGSIARRICKK